jgi:hypothetical protein
MQLENRSVSFFHSSKDFPNRQWLANLQALKPMQLTCWAADTIGSTPHRHSASNAHCCEAARGQAVALLADRGAGYPVQASEVLCVGWCSGAACAG